MLAESFTLSSALLGLAGGAMIGLSALLLLKGTSKIAGISGILNGLLHPDNNWLWRALFIIGLVAGGGYTASVMGIQLGATLSPSWPLLIIAGLLVGFGSRLGNGCTSGHGICGMGRLSLRSIVATCTFMLTGFITVYLVKHVFGG